jgi:ribosomal protein S18 acetylase RimI-like enzyme
MGHLLAECGLPQRVATGQKETVDITHAKALASAPSIRGLHHRRCVVELWEAVFDYETAHNTPGLAIDKKLATADGLFFVALSGHEVVGTVLAGYDGHRGWLYSVAVLPSHRRKGIGMNLVRHAEDALTARGCMKINLQIVSSNESVKTFYESLGYSTEPRISMGKKIESNIEIPGEQGW